MTGVLLLVVAAAAAAVQPIKSPLELAIDAYRSAAEAQLRCEDEQAMRTVAALDLGTLKAVPREIGRPNTRSRWSAKLIASALVLHARAAFADDVAEDRGSDAHIASARQLLSILSASDSSLYARVAPQWYAIVAAQLQNRLAIVRLTRHLNDVPDEFSRQPRILLARGSLHQLLASPMISREIRTRVRPPAIGMVHLPEWAASEQRVSRDLAEKNFRATIAAAPDDAEAYIRLADLLNGDGRRNEAMHLIVRADGLARTATLKYWSALIDGRIRQDGSDLEHARAAYARAAAIVPTTQAARIALAHVDLASGRTADAAGVIRTYLAASAHATADANDPWWEYMLGQAWRRHAMIEDLLRDIRSCGP